MQAFSPLQPSTAMIVGAVHSKHLDPMSPIATLRQSLYIGDDGFPYARISGAELREARRPNSSGAAQQVIAHAAEDGGGGWIVEIPGDEFSARGLLSRLALATSMVAMGQAKSGVTTTATGRLPVNTTEDVIRSLREALFGDVPAAHVAAAPSLPPGASRQLAQKGQSVRTNAKPGAVLKSTPAKTQSAHVPLANQTLILLPDFDQLISAVPVSPVSSSMFVPEHDPIRVQTRDAFRRFYREVDAALTQQGLNNGVMDADLADYVAAAVQAAADDVAYEVETGY